MLRKLLTMLLLTSHFLTYADASPKFSEKVTVSLFDQNKPLYIVDSICALVFNSWRNDTATLNYTTADYWTKATLDKENDNYIISTHGHIKSFKLICFIQGVRYESDSISRFPGNNIYLLEVKNGKLIDKSPFFHEYWSTYFFSLFITLLIEVLIGLIYFVKYRDKQTIENYLLTFSAINILTHFSLWYIYSNFDVPIFFLELLVVVFESIYWKLTFKISSLKALLVSLLTNLASWIIGLVIMIFL